MSFRYPARKWKLMLSYEGEVQKGELGEPELIRPPAPPPSPVGIVTSQDALESKRPHIIKPPLPWTKQAALAVLTIRDRLCGQLSLPVPSTPKDAGISPNNPISLAFSSVFLPHMNCKAFPRPQVSHRLSHPWPWAFQIEEHLCLFKLRGDNEKRYSPVI